MQGAELSMGTARQSVYWVLSSDWDRVTLAPGSVCAAAAGVPDVVE